MAKLADHLVWAEMARGKVQFHKDESWAKINLWGLFSWDEISHLLDSGELIADIRKENRIVWVRPSKHAWETKIKPLIETHSLEELSKIAGA